MDYSEMRLLFVFAHPGDEAISAGATIAQYARAGASVSVVTATRGEYGGISSAELTYLAQDPHALGAYREAEQANALAALGVADHRYLGGLRAHAAGAPVRLYRQTPGVDRAADPLALTAAGLTEVAADFAAVIADVRPHVIVTHNSVGGNHDPDRARVHNAVVRALDMVAEWQPDAVFVMEHPRTVVRARAKQARAFGISPLALPRDTTIDDDLVDVIVTGSDDVPAKVAALAAYGSLMRLVSGCFVLPDGTGSIISGFEYFREIGGGVYRLGSRAAGGFFSGWSPLVELGRSRVATAETGAASVGARNWIETAVTAVLIASFGALVGAVLSLIHLAVVPVGGTELAAGLALALVTLLLVALAVRGLSSARSMVIWFAAGVIGAVALLSRTGPGGDVLMPAQLVRMVGGTAQTVENLPSLIWVIGSSLLVAIIAGWPTRWNNGSTPSPSTEGTS